MDNSDPNAGSQGIRRNENNNNNNVLAQTFSGNALESLESLGVSAVDTIAVEQHVIAEALAKEEERVRLKAATKQSSVSNVAGPISRRIPKKRGRESLQSNAGNASLVVSQYVPITHMDDPDIPSNRLKQRTSTATTANYLNNYADKRKSPNLRNDTNDEGRQKLISSGYITPFSSMGEIEKSFTRVRASKPVRESSSSIITSRNIDETSVKKEPRSRATPQKVRKPITPTPDQESSDNVQAKVREESTNEDFVIPPSPPRRSSRLRNSKKTYRAAIIDELSDDDVVEFKKEPVSKVESDDGEWRGDVESDVEDDEDVPTTAKSTRKKNIASHSLSTATSRMSLNSPVLGDLDLDDDDDDMPYLSPDEEEDDEIEGYSRPRSIQTKSKRTRLHILDDFDTTVFEDRIAAARQHDALTYKVPLRQSHQSDSKSDSNDDAELDVSFEGGYLLPGRIWDRLFGWQRTSIKWLWELHCQNAGGIIADEMGLGKTIQAAAFLGGLHYTRIISRQTGNQLSEQFDTPPFLIVCPATLMAQWLREFHLWYPDFRVYVLHDSVDHGNFTKAQIVEQVFTTGHILITTYECVRIYKHLLLGREWGYVILDEGHKIRNPDAAITLVCKQFLCIHRIILSGAPIQNNLTELWSLFDFIFPGKLGTLPVFEEEFSFPIIVGGYTNANANQVQLAYQCASVLRDLINPYILRRTKADVAQHLPKKTEQVLLCNLSESQRDIYKEQLESETIRDAIDGRHSLFRAITVLRKLCNHPDLLQLEMVAGSAKRARPVMADFGDVSRSGKMLVLQHVLRAWYNEKHRVLIFTQTRQMLDILEDLMVNQGYDYRRIDGETSIQRRLPLIDEYNHNPEIFAFLLTTRAGGLGINLTGADRVVLYDPDWNPSTDLQARERAYRIGQVRPVTVYRLITRGTIEEKVYHRQIFKQFLTDKVLKDPKQRRFFSRRDMKDLFSLDEFTQSETASLFRGVTEEILPNEDNENHDMKMESETNSTAFRNARNNRTVSGNRPVQRTTKRRQPIAIVGELKDDDDAGNTPSGDANESNRILSALFNEGGLQSALDHDAILQGSSLQDKRMAEALAKRVAEKAFHALKKSRELMQNAPISAPTWTGKSGSAGVLIDHSYKPKFGQVSRIGGNSRIGVSISSESTIPTRSFQPTNEPSELFDHTVSGVIQATSTTNTTSSSALLAGLKSLPTKSSVSGLPDAAAYDIEETEGDAIAPQAQQLLQNILTYLRGRPRGVSTNEIVNHFTSSISSENEKYIFRQLLRQAAVFIHGKRKGEGMWFLKS